MMYRHSISTARSNLPQLVKAVELGDAVELTRRGKPVAMLIGLQQFQQLTSTLPGFARAYRDFSEKFDLDALAVDPDEVFADVRDRSPSREIDL